MFQLLTILLVVAAVVTKAVPLPDHHDQSQQRNVRQTVEAETTRIDLGNISAPAYIVDLFTNITNDNERAGQKQVLSNDDLVNAVRSFPNLVTGE